MENIRDSDFWKDQGNNYYKTGNYIDAIICYKRALEINPGSDKAWYNLGMTYNRMNNTKDSRLCFEKAQGLSPAGDINSLFSQGVFPREPGGGFTTPARPVDQDRTPWPDNAVGGTTWRGLLYPGEWCIWFVLVGLITSVSDKPLFVFMYYTCAIAALVSLCFLFLGIFRHVSARPSGIPGTRPGIQAFRSSNPLSTSSMNVRTWAMFFLICFVALLWAVFLSNQGMMLWVGFALVIIVVGFNLIFIFKN
jgi:hypothetical protein